VAPGNLVRPIAAGLKVIQVIAGIQLRANPALQPFTTTSTYLTRKFRAVICQTINQTKRVRLPKKVLLMTEYSVSIIPTPGLDVGVYSLAPKIITGRILSTLPKASE
jgi:hypothetical protein